MCVLRAISLAAAMLATSNVFADQHHKRIIAGVSAKFALLNPSIRPHDPLKVRVTLSNRTSHSVTFVLYGEWVQHVQPFTSRGERVDIKIDSPILEPIAVDIPLKPGETVQRVAKLRLWVWYDLAPGDYFLKFRYDLRLLPAGVDKLEEARFHSAAWIDWDEKRYPFHVFR
jgi:hypothetical protein